jgi:hypothetical protein
VSETNPPSTGIPFEGPTELSLEELRQRAARAKEIIDELKVLFPDLRHYTEDERRYSQGRLRDGEAEMLGHVLDIIEYAPHYFASLADQDEGHDPARLETSLLRDRLERRMIMGQLTDALEPLTREVGDTALYYGDLVRPVLLSAYRIAKPISKSDVRVANRLAKVVDFYTGPARAAAQTRAINKKNEKNEKGDAKDKKDEAK